MSEVPSGIEGVGFGQSFTKESLGVCCAHGTFSRVCIQQRWP